MVNCAVSGCQNYTNAKRKRCEAKFFKFPENAYVKSEWLKACGNCKKVNFKYAKICSEHFIEDDYILKDRLLNVPQKFRHLKKDAIPSQKLPEVEDPLSIRQCRSENRSRKRLVTEILHSEKTTLEPDIHSESIEADAVRNVSTQTVLDIGCARELHIMELEKENKKLKKKLQASQEENERIKDAYSSVKQFFTEGQVRKLQKKGTLILKRIRRSV